jgi:ATP-dependent Lon protease
MFGKKPTTGPLETEVSAILPLRDIVVFPGMIVPLFVGRDKSISALEDVSKEDKKILLCAQKNASVDDPSTEDIFRTGTLATILQLLKLPDGTVKVLVEGIERAQIIEYTDNDRYFEAIIERFDDESPDVQEVEALRRSVITEFEDYIKLNKKIPSEILSSLNQIDNASKLADTVISHLTLKIPQKQKLLETRSVASRLEHVFSLMEQEIGVMNTERKIRSRVKTQMEKTQKEYYLNEQMKAIQKELGDGDGGNDEIAELEQKINKTKMHKEAKEKAIGELKKLKLMSPMSAEATVVRNYLDWITGIPWKQKSRSKVDIIKAEKVLDRDHYGLEKVKERILEHLAVQQRTKSMKGPILCFVGPPGVGKTSLARSIAEATGRNFARISLGGVRDEAEIRGHRRTYIGSMPGKIIQSMKKAKKSNPLMLLDEIDKLGQDFRGDPSSALLEVLDPEQNATFNDHYLEVDYDLSEVMFITTANTLNIPRPLLDRMEVIRIAGYTEDEKVEIAKRHLLPKQAKEHAFKKPEWSVTDEAMREVIRKYTRESGVRNLEREIAKLARKSVKQLMVNKEESLEITTDNLKEFSGVPRFDYGRKEEEDRVGVTTGLAFTETGGDLLPIEAVLIPGGRGRMTITGNVKDVMKESGQAAWSYVRSRSLDFGIIPPKFQENDIHIHVPEGAIPKDGPSAGVAMCTSIVSALTGVPVSKSIAMTGEISLRGQVMPIGGLKEKLLAALRGGIEMVLIPEKNMKDLEDIPDNVKEGLEIIPVKTVDEVLNAALTGKLSSVEWHPEVKIPAADDKKTDEEGLITH